MSQDPFITAAILTGGRSQRMGRPKALLEYSGKPLVLHLAEQLQPRVSAVMLTGTPEPSLYSDLDLPVLEDRMPDAGPLAGIHSAMVQGQGDWLLVVPCDGIVLPEHFVKRLLEATNVAVDVVYSVDASGEQPLYGLYRRTLAPSLANYLQSGRRKVMDWLSVQKCSMVDFSADGFCFANLNTPQAWQEFLNEQH